jgi:hypothetical protein
LFTNFSATFMNIDGEIIPGLAASTTSALVGTCAAGTNSSTNIFIDVYTVDPEGITNGMAFALPELNGTNGIPQGKMYLGTFADNGPADSNAAVGAFNLNIASLGLSAGTDITVTANYSADPGGTSRARVHTSNFANPVKLTQGATPVTITSVTASGNTLTINWSGGTAPYSLQRKSPVTGAWEIIQPSINSTSTTDTITTNAFYRVGSN